MKTKRLLELLVKLEFVIDNATTYDLESLFKSFSIAYDISVNDVREMYKYIYSIQEYIR